MRFPFFATLGACKRYTFSRWPCGLYLISGVCCALCSTLNRLSSGIANREIGRMMKCTDLIPRSEYRSSSGCCRPSYTLCSRSTAALCLMKASSMCGLVSSSSACRRSASCSRDPIPFSCKYGKYSFISSASSAASVPPRATKTSAAKHACITLSCIIPYSRSTVLFLVITKSWCAFFKKGSMTGSNGLAGMG